MSTRDYVLSSALLLPLFSTTPAAAQRVQADIIIGGGPIAGRVIIGDRGRDGYRGRPRQISRIEWIRFRDYRREDDWRRFERESRPIVAYWDRDDNNYYLDRFRSGLVEIRVYERGGRFYRLADDRRDDRYLGRDDRRDNWWDDRRARRPDYRGNE